MKNDKMKNQYRVNEQIRVREVRVVSDGGSEVIPTRKALDMARQQGVDLVEISPNAQPPVCRLIDYSKFLYQQKKHQKEVGVFFSRNKARCSSFDLPTIWKNTARWSRCQNLKARKCFCIWLRRKRVS